MLRIPWTDHKTNEEVLVPAQGERSLLTTLKQRQKKRLSHVMRHDSLEGWMEGKKTRGRPGEMLLDWLTKH